LLRFGRPSARAIEERLGSTQPHTYPEVGSSAQLDDPDVRARLAKRYDLDTYALSLGRGRDRFERARLALTSWRHFDVPWALLHRAGPVATGQVVATLVGFAGVWLLNPCRVVYADLASDGDCAAFGYGTLPGHAESGEERFRITFDPRTEEVVYEIAAFSRPALVLTRLGYPLARRVQKRFARASAAALKNAVS
jgi:uncharacterized protein (UPF0548 family)